MNRSIALHTRGGLPQLSFSLALFVVALVAACGDGATEPEPTPNRAPTVAAAIPAQTIGVGETATVNVASSFSDPDGDPLVFSAETSNAAVATVAVSGSTVTVAAVARGEATVSVTARDPGGLEAEQSFAVTVPNRAPVVTDSIADIELSVGDTATVDASSYFSDPDGDALVYEAASSDEDVATVSVSGTVISVLAVAQGEVTVTVTARDPGGLEADQTFGVRVPNRAPATADPIPDVELAVGDTLVVDAMPYFSDPDGDALEYEASSSDTAVATVSLSGAAVSVAAVARGEATVTIAARDPGGLAVELNFGVTVPNQAPVASDTIADVELIAGDTALVDAMSYFSDPDGDALIYDATSSDTAVAMVGVSGATIGMVGVAAGTAAVTVTASDPDGLEASHSFGVTVSPMPAVVNLETSSVEVPEGGTAVLKVVLAMPPASPITVAYSLSADADQETADADSADYGASSGSIEIGTDATEASWEISILDDEDVESPREVFTLTLDMPPDDAVYALGSTRASTVTILEGVCDRTRQVRDEIVAQAAVDQCTGPDNSHLATIQVLDLSLGSETAASASRATIREMVIIPDEEMFLDWGTDEPATVEDRIWAGEVPGRYATRGATMMGNGPEPIALSRRQRPSDDPITALKRRDFAGLTGLQTLDLSGNELTSVPQTVFAGLSSLVQLDISDNQLAELPAGVFQDLSNLQRLDTGGNPMASGLGTGAFRGLSSLDSLDLSGTDITEIPTDAFSGLSSLVYLNLNGAFDSEAWSFQGRLTHLPEGVFSGLSSLETLYLRGHQLIGLPDGAFTDLSRLRELYLGSNQIARLQRGLFASPSDLEVLELGKSIHVISIEDRIFEPAGTNPITELEGAVFAGLSSLRKLYLEAGPSDGGTLSELPDGVFTGLSRLEVLWLMGQPITRLPDGVFADLSRLDSLNLRGNQLEELPADPFAGLSRLTYLNLGNHLLSRLPEGVFSDLSSLEYLSLRAGYGEGDWPDSYFHRLTELPPGVFDGLTNLTRLWLDGNGLTELSADMFADLTSLEYLGFFANNLSNLAGGVFSNLTNLTWMSLGYNQLASLPVDAFAGLSSLETLRVYSNPLTALPAGVFTGLGSLRWLDLGGNELTELPAGVFLGLSNLETLQLWGNPGAPFPLTLELQAPSSATVTVTVAEGAPFAMEVPLSAEGGELSASVAAIPTGGDTSSSINVTRSAGNTGGVEVTIGSLPEIPRTDRTGMHGITLEAGGALVLFGGSSTGASRDAESGDGERNR